MTRKLGPGPASMAGLEWLAKVGPSPLDAWRSAMGWSEVAARSHARRLQDRGWLARYPMTRGEGRLFAATRTGVTIAHVPASVASPPRTGSWPQHITVAWTAAWVTLRGRVFHGPRELLLDPRWTAELQWHDQHGQHRAAHRPALVAHAENDRTIAIEVVLSRRSATRARAELSHHTRWQTNGRTHGVIYVCGNETVRQRITSNVDESGFAASGLAIRIVTSDRIRDQALAELQRRRAEQRNLAAADPAP
jgi:hypothetical protein